MSHQASGGREVGGHGDRVFLNFVHKKEHFALRCIRARSALEASRHVLRTYLLT